MNKVKLKDDWSIIVFYKKKNQPGKFEEYVNSETAQHFPSHLLLTPLQTLSPKASVLCALAHMPIGNSWILILQPEAMDIWLL